MLQLLSLLCWPSLKSELKPDGPAELLVQVPVLKPGSLNAKAPAKWGEPWPERPLTEVEQLPLFEEVDNVPPWTDLSWVWIEMLQVLPAFAIFDVVFRIKSAPVIEIIAAVVQIWIFMYRHKQRMYKNILQNSSEKYSITWFGYNTWFAKIQYDISIHSEHSSNLFRESEIWKQIQPDRWFNPAFQKFINTEIATGNR